MAMVYEWSEDRRFNVPAEKVGAEVEAIAAEVGECSPRAFWQRTEVMRDHFEWDNERAGDMYRDTQARGILNSLRVIQVVDNRKREAPAFVSVSVTNPESGGSSRGYRPVAEAMAQPDLRRQVLEEAKRQLNALRRRYGHLKEFSEVWSAIEAVDSEEAAA